jgi:hypothetical protein
MSFSRTKSVTLFAVLGILAFAATANASELLTNGSFESGLFNPWVVTNSTTDGSSWFVNTGLFTPLNGNPTPGASDGTHYAVTDGFGPGSHALTQTFLNPLGTVSATLSLDIFVNDVYRLGGSFGQVDLLAGGANALTGTPIHVFYNADTFQVNPGTSNGYVHLSMDISSYMTAGQSYQLRILETDTAPFDVGVDNLSIVNTIGQQGTPEPATFLPGALMAGLFVLRSRRKARL